MKNQTNAAVYEVRRNEAQVYTKGQPEDGIVNGITLDQDNQDPEVIGTFDNLQDAIKVLAAYKSSYYYQEGNPFNVWIIEEYYVEKNTYNEYGEWLEGGDVHEFAQWR